MKKLALILYYSIAAKLPNSSFPLGSFFNKIRNKIIGKIIKIGKNCKIQKNVYIGNGLEIEIGNSCQINDNVRLDNVKISDNVMIARDCIILGKKHEFNSTDIPMIHQGHVECAPTIIEDDVWIAARCIIMPNLLLSRGCIIAAGAVLTKDTVPFGIYAGIPAMLIKKRI